MQGKFLCLGGDEQHSQRMAWLWRVEMQLERGFPIPPAKRAKFKINLREIKSSVWFQQMSVTGEGTVPTGVVTEVKEPFWPAVQCAEGEWSPSLNNALSKGREEGQREVKWHAPGHMESKCKAQQSARSCCTVTASLPDTLQEVNGGIPRNAVPADLTVFLTQRPQSQYLTVGCCSSHEQVCLFWVQWSFCLRGHLQIIQSSKDGRTLCTYKEITVVFNFWWEQLFGKKRFPFFVEPNLRGFISCAPQVSPGPAFWRTGGLGNGSQHVHEDSFGPGIFSWEADPWSASPCQLSPALAAKLPWNATISSQYHTQKAIRTSQGKSKQP